MTAWKHTRLQLAYVKNTRTAISWASDYPRTTHDSKKTVKFTFAELLELAEGGDEFAMSDVAYAYALGRKGVEKDPAKAAEWMLWAAETGDEEAQYMVGRFFLLGFGVAPSLESARHWFTLAAKNGHKKALLQLIEMSGQDEGDK